MIQAMLVTLALGAWPELPERQPWPVLPAIERKEVDPQPPKQQNTCPNGRCNLQYQEPRRGIFRLRR
jgi:hypothetical protein